MNVQTLKKYVPLLPWGVCAVAAVILAATAARLYGYMDDSSKLAATLEQCKAQNKPDEQKTKDLLAEAKKAGDELKKKNVFTPPPPKPQPPTCQGILGDSALFGDKLYKVGEKIGAAEIVSIGATEVVIKWEGEEKTLRPFEGNGGGGGRPDERRGPSRSSGARPPTPQRGPSTTQVVGGGPPGPGGPGDGRSRFMNMSPEQRQQMIDRFRNMSPEERERFREEQRQRFGGRGGFGGRGSRGR